jgi:hypothetical protein
MRVAEKRGLSFHAFSGEKEADTGEDGIMRNFMLVTEYK